MTGLSPRGGLAIGPGLVHPPEAIPDPPPPPPDAPTFSGLYAWYDASQETGLVDGQVLTQFTDFSGNGRHTSRAGGTPNFTYQTNELNGLPVFRGTEDRMIIPDGVPGTSTWSVYLVVVMDSLPNAARYFLDGSPDDSHRYAQFMRATFVSVGVLVWNSVAFDNGDNPHFADAPANTASGTWRRLVAVRGTNLQIWQDGSAGSSVAAGTGTTQAAEMAIFGSARDSLASFIWRMGEVGIYNRALTTSERVELDTYLSAKWGI